MFDPPVSRWRAVVLDLTAFFVTIASVLGTGILGLPVKLVSTGFWPFCLIFLLGLLMQLASVVLMTEVLQIAKTKMRDAAAAASWHEVQDTEAEPLMEPGASAAGAVEAATPRRPASDSPDLHTLGRMFLSQNARVVFDVVVFLHFAFILISYALAGSQSFAQLTSLPLHACLTPFVLVLTLLVVFASRSLSPLIAAMTATKTFLLLSIIVVVGILSNQVNVGATSQWTSILNPFLISTVALGGTVCLYVSGPRTYLDFTPRSCVVYVCMV
jgi:amino acid permease